MAKEAMGEAGTSNEALSFNDLFEQQIKLLGDQNQPEANPWNRSIGIPVFSPSFDYTEDSHGKIGFGLKWNVHRLVIDSKELVYAHHPVATSGLRVSGEFYVNEFNSYALEARTKFYASETGAVHKTPKTRFGSGLFTGLDFQRVLDAIEVEELHSVIRNPRAEAASLAGLVAITATEQELIAESTVERAARRAEYNKSMDTINKMHVVQYPYDPLY